MKWKIFNIQNLTDEEYRRQYSAMSEDGRKRTDRFRDEDDKKRTASGEMLARQMISEELGILPEEISFGRDSLGKPYASGLDIHFNISHSGDYAVCAVSECPIGIDVEHIRPVNLRPARAVCSEAELRYIFGKAPSEEDFGYTEDRGRLRRFFEIWTGKEAAVKLTGRGIGDIRNTAVPEGINTYVCEEYVVSIAEEK